MLSKQMSFESRAALKGLECSLNNPDGLENSKRNQSRGCLKIGCVTPTREKSH